MDQDQRDMQASLDAVRESATLTTAAEVYLLALPQRIEHAQYIGDVRVSVWLGGDRPYGDTDARWCVAIGPEENVIDGSADGFVGMVSGLPMFSRLGHAERFAGSVIAARIRLLSGGAA